MAQFRTRARALDLLGRQQIAGIPTAINELFKNAHDAYADNVDIDYIRKDKLFVLRDNGLGMTKDEFESRWLTLGTESKFQNSKTSLPPVDSNKDPRPIMGEKGIGRLAIASIGPQVLILTKSNKEPTKKIVAAFINWRIFELPGLNLEDVVIPIRMYENIPTFEDIQLMKQDLINSLNFLYQSEKISEEDTKRIISLIEDFRISPFDLDQLLIGDFNLIDTTGTHFYITPTDESLNFDIDGEKDKSVSTKMEKMLLGFTNTMTPDHPTPKILPAFRDYKGIENTYTDIFNKENFFNPEDFRIADHHFSGEFDEYGQFSGNVNVYKVEDYSHKIPWSGNNYKKTECGPFKINVAYLQGELKQSIIDAENHSRLIAKTNRQGGLYLYKDNIRILPYGNSDNDWLDIEKNRAKSASFYFFNARRMFGVIDISSELNQKLNEKAGREGFIENKAYRQFRDILKNFFVQLAADFFREGSGAGPKSETWVKKREERKSYYQALERRDKQAKVRKDKFQSSLNSFFENISKNTYNQEIDRLLNKIEKKFETVIDIEDAEEASQLLVDTENEAREIIADYISKLKINQPKGFTISKETRKDYEAYLTEFDKIQNGKYREAADQIDNWINDYSTRLQIEVSKRKRLEQAVDFISIQAEKASRQKQKEAKEALAEVSKNVMDLARELMIGLEDKIRDIKDDFKNIEINSSEDFDLVNERRRIEDEISKERDKVTFTLESVIKQLHEIYWNKDNNAEIITSDQIADAMSEELEELRDRLQADVELSQLGLAVGVIHHEFSSTVNSIRGSIRDLKAWADVNDKLENVYNNIRVNFEHLDGYLGLFTPFNRRLYREKEQIPSNEIKIFLLDLFGARLERHKIQLKNTGGFQKRKLFGFRSTFYPVFVNIIDNAIHWLNQSNEEEKIIRLHADDSGFYISNNGPEISIQDSERIFDLGYTKKLNGRGMGLHISREVLNAEGYNIFLDTPKEGSTVTFKIEQINP
jgi:signal transduction histidine kinase